MELSRGSTESGEKYEITALQQAKLNPHLRTGLDFHFRSRVYIPRDTKGRRGEKMPILESKRVP